MCFFKKDKRIDWPFVVIIPVILGIIFATLALVLRVIETGKDGGHFVNSDRLRIEAEAKQEKVAQEYYKDLQNLSFQISQAKDWKSAFALSESAFFSMRVPQVSLEKHLQAWLKISELNEQKQDVDGLGKIIADLIVKEIK